MFRSSIFTCMLLVLCSSGSFGQSDAPFVVVTNDPDVRTTVSTARDLQQRGYQVDVVAGKGCMIVRGDASDRALVGSRQGVASVFSTVAASDIQGAVPEHRATLRWLQELNSGAMELRSTSTPMAWSTHLGGDALERPTASAQSSFVGGSRSVGGAPPDWTCSQRYNSERMAGTVVASTFFVESDGSIDADDYTWTTADINDVKAQIIDAWSIWAYTASLSGQSIMAIMDWYEPASGIPVQGYEPILHASYQDDLWTNAIMDNLGYTSQNGQFNKLDAFNYDSRQTYDAESAFSCFIAYNPPSGGAPNAMTDGRIGYAYLGGPYTQILFKANGWTTSQVGRVYGHEVGHIFHAFDEYASSTASNCNRSFNGEVNSNYHGSTCNGTQNCVMVDNSFQGSGATRQWRMCSHTPYHLGWIGSVAPATLLSPINNNTVLVDPVTLSWNRNGAPASAISYVKVFERNTGNEVYCEQVGTLTEWTGQLINGDYDWSVSLGNANDANGYAGVNSSMGQFKVSAPLAAAFSVYPNSICAGDVVYMNEFSSGAPITWNWSFPGGVPSSFNGQDPPSVRYDLPGTYNIYLTVGDGIGADQYTFSNAVSVTGGLPLDQLETMNTGQFPPNGWTLGGGVGGGGSLQWEADPVPSCSQSISAYVDGFNFTGQFGSASLSSPKYDLISASAPYLSFEVSHAAASASSPENLSVYLYDCQQSIYQQVYQKQGLQLATNGGSYQPSPRWQPQTCDDVRLEIVSLDALKGQIAAFNMQITSQGGQVVYVDNVRVFDGTPLPVRVFLDGPYEPGSGLMGDALRQAGLVPITEPYTAFGFTYHGEGEPVFRAADMFLTGADAIVDWVVLEVRSSQDPTRIITSRAALLQRDGDVVDLNGNSVPFVGVSAGAYHVAVIHRNHLAIMTGVPVQLGTGAPTIDFTDPATSTWGTEARVLRNNKALMWTGDATRDQRAQYTGTGNDRDKVLIAIGGAVPTNVTQGYLNEDLNMNGITSFTGTSNDRDLILQTIGGAVPTNVREAQLP